MSDQTGISWCDSTANFWIGCTKISPACDFCYAERDMDIRLHRVKWGAGQPRLLTGLDNRQKPFRWNERPFVQCENCGWRGEKSAFFRLTTLGFRRIACPHCESTAWMAARRRVFHASLADWLDNEVPIEWFVDLLDTIRQTPNLDWLQLTKRIGNWRARLEDARRHVIAFTENYDLGIWIDHWLNGEAPANIWMGSTVINQAEADRDIPKLLAISARVRFLSIEPMLGPIDFRKVPGFNRIGLDLRGWWVIAGGESGPHARPSDCRWFRNLRDQCEAAGVAFHFKQNGEWLCFDRSYPGITWDDVSGAWQIKVDGRLYKGLNVVISDDDKIIAAKVGRNRAARLLDGIQYSAFPVVAS